MKKDFVNSGAKILSALLLVFFCFVGSSELNAQTFSTSVTTPATGAASLDVDLSQYTFIDDLSAANIYLNEAQDILGVLNANSDPVTSDMVTERVQKDVYKFMYYNINAGASVVSSLEMAVGKLNDSAAMHHPNITLNEKMSIFMGAVNLAVQ